MINTEENVQNLEYLQLEICIDSESQEVILFDCEAAKELLRISNTEDHRQLLRSFSGIMDNVVARFVESAYEDGINEGRDHALENKETIKKLAS